MLDTRERAIYLEELKPPEGFQFDSAIATTFTLDLLTLLMAPLSLSLYEAGDRDELLRDPVLLLDALTKVASNFSIFCQDGYISVPKKSSLLYSYLEDSVFPVKPNRGGGIFHPKLWILRYVREDEVFYRLLNLSRNLTFDQSWDVMVCLEGYARTRRNGFSKNKPLYDFILSLENMSTLPISEERKRQIEMIAHEAYRVDFEVPEGFEELTAFAPSGIRGYKNQDIPQSFDRALIISPFLTEEGVDILRKQGENNILISRAESLDTLSEETYEDIIRNTSLYYLNQSVEEPEEALETEQQTDEGIRVGTKGLHAKLFLFHHGWNATLISGSANATTAALTGENVEFMIHLAGKRSRIGIDACVGKTDEHSNALMNLLLEYKRYEERIPEEDEQEKLDKVLREIRDSIVSSSLYGEVLAGNNDTFTLKIESESRLPIISEDVTILCYPISLSRSYAEKPTQLEKVEICFESISLQALTSFIAIELSADRGDYSSEISFVANININGMPTTERNNSILASILHDRGSFIRYLLLILVNDPDAFQLAELFLENNGGKEPSSSLETKLSVDIPLLEELVRAFSREPEKIERIAKLVEDIGKTNKANELMPPYFEETWKTFLHANNERGSI